MPLTAVAGPTSVAFAGAGWVTVVHGMAAAAVDDVRVVRVASRTPASARRRAAQAGAAPARYDELPGGAEAVVVATPPAAHLAEARRAVEGGALALVETPLAATLADADAIVALGGQGHVAYAESLVHSPVVAEAVGAGRRLGPLTYLEVRLAQGRPAPGGGRLTPAWGGGVLLDLGVHALALALLLAAPARVTAVEADLRPGDDLEVDDDATVVLTFDGGLTAQVRATWRSAAPVWDAQAASADSALRVELVPDPAVELNGVRLRLPRPPGGLPTDQLHHLGYLDQMRALAADARAQRPPRVGAPLGRLLLEVVCAAATSAGTGGPVPLPFAGPRDRTPHELWTGRGPTGPAPA
ncbi:MAG TPA: Gfo/Idh/MocA family oxidoreductase [Acidimicrobiales bacterium]|nr:Gfo/Idh/MocA family oxidoreductase [Acidimicrobiales bacterium]